MSGYIKISYYTKMVEFLDMMMKVSIKIKSSRTSLISYVAFWPSLQHGIMLKH